MAESSLSNNVGDNHMPEVELRRPRRLINPPARFRQSESSNSELNLDVDHDVTPRRASATNASTPRRAAPINTGVAANSDETLALNEDKQPAV
jgi:hypothetical protein